MNWYPWLNAPYRQLVGQHSTGRGHHALLLHSLPGNGEDALIYALSRWLMCQQRQGEKSCGECHSCRLMLAGNHPDWYVLTPEKGKSSIGVELVRQLIDKLYSHAQQGGAKVVWLPHAEVLTDAAANALLKRWKSLQRRPIFCWIATNPPACWLHCVAAVLLVSGLPGYGYLSAMAQSAMA